MHVPADAAILRRLRRGEFIPAADLPDPTRIPALIAAGYEIEHHPHLGYRLLTSPDRLIADDILSRLPDDAGRWVRDILVFQSTSSTNDIITALARDGAPAGIAAFAEEQTAGRGRLGRQWQSPPGLGLWFSLLLRPDLPIAEWPRLTLWLACALARAIREHTPVDIMLKWPNDLYLGGRKLAGILVETSLGESPFATAGIGLNVNHAAFPPPLDTTATSLRIHTGAPLDRNALAASILTSIGQSLPLLGTHFADILKWARGADCLRGRQVSATAGSTTYYGVALGLDPGGALLLRTPAGDTVRVTSGEVTRFSASPA
jgi:BirA family biotin operon repressor/biotin-[acetyl-CoA-carboxylase] ligase